MQPRLFCPTISSEARIMRTEMLEPATLLYTERMNDLRSDEIVAQIRTAREHGYEDMPVFVLPLDAFPGRYAIVEGNHHAWLAEREKRLVSAVVIETPEDFEKAERVRPTVWGDSIEGNDAKKTRFERAQAAIYNAAVLNRRNTGRLVGSDLSA